MKKAVILVGLPGSGKSTIRKKLLDKMDNNAFVYSTDDYVDDIAKLSGSTYSEMWDQLIGEATDNMDSQLQERKSSGTDILWDQTNIGVKKRKHIVNLLKGYKVECHCILPPRDVDEESELWLRLENRQGKEIPQHVIRNMWNTYVTPTSEEGFDNIVFYDIYGKLL